MSSAGSVWYVENSKLCYEIKIKFTMHLRIILALYVSIVYVYFFMRGAVRTHGLHSPVYLAIWMMSLVTASELAAQK